jgi:hypothetical protein
LSPSSFHRRCRCRGHRRRRRRSAPPATAGRSWRRYPTRQPMRQQRRGRWSCRRNPALRPAPRLGDPSRPGRLPTSCLQGRRAFSYSSWASPLRCSRCLPIRWGSVIAASDGTRLYYSWWESCWPSSAHCWCSVRRAQAPCQAPINSRAEQLCCPVSGASSIGITADPEASCWPARQPASDEID